MSPCKIIKIDLKKYKDKNSTMPTSAMTTKSTMTTNSTIPTAEDTNFIKIELKKNKDKTSTMAQPKMKQPNYTNSLLIIQMRDELDLFDEIPYKWVSESDDDDDVEVDIVDLECDKPNWCKTQFTFELYWKTQKKTFEVVLEYADSGFYANYISELELCSCCDQPINGMNADSNEDGAICENCANESDEEDDDDDWKYLCPNLHWGGQYGCDLCMDCADSKNSNMEKEWLNSNGKYCYKLHKKWMESDDN